MAIFMVLVDLVCEKDETRDYSGLYTAINELDSQHVQDSVWLVADDVTAEVLSDYVCSAVEERDRVLVVPFDHRPEGQNPLPTTEEWLVSHGLSY